MAGHHGHHGGGYGSGYCGYRGGGYGHYGYRARLLRRLRRLVRRRSGLRLRAPAYPYAYPAAGLGVATRNFSFWLGQ